MGGGGGRVGGRQKSNEFTDREKMGTSTLKRERYCLRRIMSSKLRLGRTPEGFHRRERVRIRCRDRHGGRYAVFATGKA